MAQIKEIGLFTLVATVFLVWFGAIIPQALSQGNVTSALNRLSEQQGFVNNSDVLQACVTALIGILIFLTLERKFEKRHQPLERLALEQNVSSLDSDITSDINYYGI